MHITAENNNHGLLMTVMRSLTSCQIITIQADSSCLRSPLHYYKITKGVKAESIR